MDYDQMMQAPLQGLAAIAIDAELETRRRFQAFEALSARLDELNGAGLTGLESFEVEMIKGACGLDFLDWQNAESSVVYFRETGK